MSNSVKCFFVNRFRYFRPNRSAAPKLRFVTVGPDRDGMYREVFDIPMYHRRRRSYGKPIRPVFISLDSEEFADFQCKQYEYDEEDHFAGHRIRPGHMLY